MLDAERVKVAFLLGRIHEEAITGESPGVLPLVQNALDILLSGNENAQGWDINGRPLK